MHADKLIQGRFLKAADFDGKPWTSPPVANVKLEKLEGNTGARIRGVLYFEGFDKGWVLNRTNLECLKAMFGHETDNWIGRRVTLHPVVWSGEDLAIRVKGSPDIERPIQVEVKLPRKKPFVMQLQKVGGAGGKPAQKTAANGKAAAPDGVEREPTEEEIAAGEAKAKEEDVQF